MFWRALALGEMIVISRALLHFERLERPPGPVDARMRAAMNLMARTRAPFEAAGLHIVWQDRHAAVWSWDKAQLRALGAPEEGWFMPEPLLDTPAPPGAQDGEGAVFTLIERRDGFEGQIRQGGALAVSRFWARRPDGDEIARFRRAAHGAPEPDAAWSASEPRQGATSFSAPFLEMAARFRPVHGAALALVLIGPPLLHAAGSQARLMLEHEGAQRALEAFAEGSAGDFGALERYRDHSAQLAVYRDALEQINPLTPAADLAEAARALDGRITMLRIEPDSARARIEAGGALDPALLAQALEARASLVNVRLNRTANSPAWEAEADLARTADPRRGQEARS